MTSPESGSVPPRRNLLSYIDDLPARGKREAYWWREGVRWRHRSYAELHARVLACAGRLAAAGLTPGDPVLIQGPEGADWVEALLGTLRAGGVAVPLESATTVELRSRIARVVGARLLVAPRAVVPAVAPPENVEWIDLGSWPPGAFDPPPPPALGPDDRAEVIFTSGTTGDPKGVVLTHGNVVSDFAPIERGFRKRERLARRFGTVRFLSTLPLSHMFGQAMSVFLPLAMGLTVVFVAARPREVREAARRRKAWGLFAIPRLLEVMAADLRRTLKDQGRLEAIDKRRARLAHWPYYLQAIAFARIQRLFGPRFRLMVVGGAALPEGVQGFWESLGYLVVQGYGLTETAPIVSLSNPFNRKLRGVGRPLSGQEVRLGPDGEVLVRGPNVTPGYVGSPQATAEGGWFRTGDVGEIDALGRLRILGRLKDVIVTPEGENVHPEDVERALAAIPGVREWAVIGLPAGGSDRVHAVLVLEEGATAAKIVAEANTTLLPKQRIRGHTVWPERQLPRTSTGKVRKGLIRERVIAMEAGGRADGASAASPGGVRRLVAIATRTPPDEIAGSARLADELGLSSLDLVEMSVAMEEEFGVSLGEERLAVATVEELERIVADAVTGATSLASAIAVGPASGGEAFPASISGSGQRLEAAMQRAEDGPGSAAALPLPRWARWAPVRLARRALIEILYVPFVHIFARPEVHGLEHIRQIAPPFLLVANHRSHLDAGLFMTLLPSSLRGRIAPGMTTRHFRAFFGHDRGVAARRPLEWLRVRLIQFFFHAWPLPEAGGLRESLSYAGELADAGYCLLIFPEGRLVAEGAMESFRSGIGLFARELRVPVIPAYHEGTSRVLPDGAWWPRPGVVRLTIGAALDVEPDADAGEATRLIEAAVRSLRQQAPSA